MLSEDQCKGAMLYLRLQILSCWLIACVGLLSSFGSLHCAALLLVFVSYLYLMLLFVLFTMLIYIVYNVLGVLVQSC